MTSKVATVKTLYRAQALCCCDSVLNHVNSWPKSRVPTSRRKARHTALRANHVYGLRRIRTPRVARHQLYSNVEVERRDSGSLEPIVRCQAACAPMTQSNQ